VELRGNVPTRLRKLGENPWDGIVLARAGLERLGYDFATFSSSTLPVDRFLPAGGQGIIALQVRAADAERVRVVSAIGDEETLLCLRAERDFLRRLDGDCNSPVGVLATIERRRMTLAAQVFIPPDLEPKTGKDQVRITDQQPEDAAAALFQWMYGKQT
jgi:porphobilinogen deaminase